MTFNVVMMRKVDILDQNNESEGCGQRNPQINKNINKKRPQNHEKLNLSTNSQLNIVFYCVWQPALCGGLLSR